MVVSLEGKIALVTGGSRGIGSAIALKLAARGARVAITYNRDRARAEETASRAPSGAAHVYQASIEDPRSVANLFDAFARDFDRLDILVNNAGVFGVRPVGAIDHQFFAEQFETNVWGLIDMTQSALPYFPQSGGRIVNLSTQRIYQPKGGTGVYAASKAAVSALTSAFAAELGPRHITVNAVAPGVTLTDISAKMPPEMMEATIKATPLGRVAEPEDIADVVAFLASPESGWITGQTILADGGWT